MKRSVYVFGMCLVVLLFQGCGGMDRLRGTEELVQTSGKKPALVEKSRGCVVKDKERMCMGLADRISDLDVAVRVAELVGKRMIVETIATTIRVEGTRGLSGPDREDVGRFFEDSFSWLTDNVRVSGAMLDQTYWEKYSRTSGPDVSYFYRAYGFVRIDEADYMRARDQAITDLIAKAIQEKNRRAEMAARDVKKRLLEPEE